MIREVAVQDLAKVADGDGTDFADSFVRLAGLRSIDRAPYNVGASVTDLLVGGPHEDEPNGVDVVDGVGFEPCVPHVGRQNVEARPRELLHGLRQTLNNTNTTCTSPPLDEFAGNWLEAPATFRRIGIRLELNSHKLNSLLWSCWIVGPTTIQMKYTQKVITTYTFIAD